MSGAVNSDLHIFALVKQKNGQQKTQNKIVGRVWHLTDFKIYEMPEMIHQSPQRPSRLLIKL